MVIDMKHCLLSIILCLCASCAWAFTPGFLGAVASGGGGADPCTGFLVCEGFEATGVPSGWSMPDVGTNPDYTVTPLVGNQSLKMAVDGYNGATKMLSASGTIYVHFVWKTTDTQGGTYRDIFSIKSGGDTVTVLAVNDANVRVYNGSWATPQSYTISPNTAYHFWLIINMTNKTTDAYVGTTTTRPAEPLLVAPGNSTHTSVDSFTLADIWYGSYGAIAIFDQVLISDASFSMVP